MQRCNRRVGLLGAVAIGSLLAFAPHRASAQLPVTDVAGNAQWLQQTITQIKSLAQQAQQYGTQLAQYQTELNQYTNMVTNTVALPTEVWSTVQSDIMRVQALSNASSLLSGSSGSLITRLQNASAYANQAGSLANIGNQIGDYQTTIGNNLSTMGVRRLGCSKGRKRTTSRSWLPCNSTHSRRRARCRRSRPGMSWRTRRPPSSCRYRPRSRRQRRCRRHRWPWMPIVKHRRTRHWRSSILLPEFRPAAISSGDRCASQPLRGCVRRFRSGRSARCAAVLHDKSRGPGEKPKSR